MGRSLDSETDRCDIITILCQGTLEFPCHRDVFVNPYKNHIFESSSFRRIPAFIDFLPFLSLHLTLAYLIASSHSSLLPPPSKKFSLGSKNLDSSLFSNFTPKFSHAKLNSKISRFSSTTTGTRQVSFNTNLHDRHDTKAKSFTFPQSRRIKPL
jgi:hypothetical protein